MLAETRTTAWRVDSLTEAGVLDLAVFSRGG